MKLYKEDFYCDRGYNYLALNNDNGTRVVQIPYDPVIAKVKYKEFFYLYSNSFKLSSNHTDLDKACYEVSKHIEVRKSERENQKRLTRLEEVYTMLTSLIYKGEK